MTKRLFSLLTSLLLIMSSGSLYANDNPLIGEWVSISRTKGGLGGSKNFRGDGTVVITYGALIDFTYKLKGNILTLIDEKGELILDQKVKISASSINIKNVKTGSEQNLNRITGKDSSSIIGKWVGSHYTGGDQIMHFTNGKYCYFSVPMVQATASYQLNGDIYIEASAKKGKTKWKVIIKDDLLTLTKLDGSKTESYRKKK